MKTIDKIKEIRTVPESVKEKRKEFNRLKKEILKSLSSGPKTIPQIAKETKLPIQIITFNLMTCRKYGEIETGELDDLDEYFTYQITKK